jgi:hypothetical protein
LLIALMLRFLLPQAMSDFWWQHVKPAEMLLQHTSQPLRQRLQEAHFAAANSTSDSINSDPPSSGSTIDERLQSIVQSDAELSQLVSQLNAFKPSKVHPFAAEIKARSKQLLNMAPKRQFSAAETQRAGIAALGFVAE